MVESIKKSRVGLANGTSKYSSLNPLVTSATHIFIENISPSVNNGQFPAKRIVGDKCLIEADIFRHGFEKLNAVLKWRKRNEVQYHDIPMTEDGNDHWTADIILDEVTRYYFTIEART